MKNEGRNQRQARQTAETSPGNLFLILIFLSVLYDSVACEIFYLISFSLLPARDFLRGLCKEYDDKIGFACFTIVFVNDCLSFLSLNFEGLVWNMMMMMILSVFLVFYSFLWFYSI